MTKAAEEEAKIRNHPPTHQDVFATYGGSGGGGGVAVGDIVIPNFDFPRKKPVKKSPQPQHQAQPQPILQIDCLELPTKQTREIMRQVSGLGMEDPVFGLSNHSIIRAAAKNMPFKNLYDDMKLTDIPADMRDMLTVCSDPTASLHNESWSSFHNSKNLHKELHDSRVARMLTSSVAVLTTSNSMAMLHKSHNTMDSDVTRRCQPQSHDPQASASSINKRRQNFVHPFVPPKSVSELVEQEKAEEEKEKARQQRKHLKQQQGLDITTSKSRPQIDVIYEEKPSDRRWRKSTIAKRLQQHKDEITQIRQSIDENAEVIIPSFPTKSKKKNSRKDRLHQSEQNFSFQLDQQQQQRNEDELRLEDLFTASRPQQQQRRNNTNVSRSKLSASDSNLIFDGARGLKSLDKLEGMEVNVALTRTISGLTIDNSQRTEPSRRSMKEPIIPEHGEEGEEEEDELVGESELDYLMKQRSMTFSELMKERSMTLSELQNSTHHTPKQEVDNHDDDHSSSSNLSCSHSLSDIHANTDPPSPSKKESASKPKPSKGRNHHHHRTDKTNEQQPRLEAEIEYSRTSRDAFPRLSPTGRRIVSGDRATKEIQMQAPKININGSDWVVPAAVTPEDSQNEGLRFDFQLAGRSLENVGQARRCRSHSLERREGKPSKQALSAAAVHRRPVKEKITPKADSCDTGMRICGDMSPKAAERKNEVKSTCTRYKERAIEIAGGGRKKSRDKSRPSTKQTSDEHNKSHVSMNQMVNEKTTCVHMDARSKSYGHVEYDMHCA